MFAHANSGSVLPFLSHVISMLVKAVYSMYFMSAVDLTEDFEGSRDRKESIRVMNAKTIKWQANGVTDKRPTE